MQKSTKLLLIIGVIVLFLILFSYFAIRNCWFGFEYCASVESINLGKDFCEINNGKWLKDFNECEGISKENCDLAGGEFNECQSACRHIVSDEPVICTLQCVPVCKFQENIIGGDKDEYGCIGSAGYSWCESKQKCLRTWEEECWVCPEEKNINCMPIIDPNSSFAKYCDGEYNQWIKENCNTTFLD